MTRRPGLSALLLVVTLAAGCRRAEPKEAPFRLGFFPNITHAQALVGAADGTFARALGGVTLQTRPFSAGPTAMEALLGGSLDMTYVGASPAIIAFVRSGGATRVVAGAASGGALFVVRDAKRPKDLIGKRVAAPQVGNTQDVALRHFLRAAGLDASDRPGRDVTVLPLSNPEIVTLFKQRELDGAWVPEPWASRMILEERAQVLVDERDLWEGGRFPTTVLVATKKALEQRPAEVAAVVRAHRELTLRWKEDPKPFQQQTNAAFQQATGKKLSAQVLDAAFSRLSLDEDPLEPQLLETGRRLHEVGYLPAADLGALVDRRFLGRTSAAR